MVVNHETSTATDELPASWVNPSRADRLLMKEVEHGARRGAQLPGGQPDSATLANIRERVFYGIGSASSPTEASPAQQSQTSTAPAQEEQ